MYSCPYSALHPNNKFKSSTWSVQWLQLFLNIIYSMDSIKKLLCEASWSIILCHDKGFLAGFVHTENIFIYSFLNWSQWLHGQFRKHNNICVKCGGVSVIFKGQDLWTNDTNQPNDETVLVFFLSCCNCKSTVQYNPEANTGMRLCKVQSIIRLLN